MLNVGAVPIFIFSQAALKFLVAYDEHLHWNCGEKVDASELPSIFSLIAVTLQPGVLVPRPLLVPWASSGPLLAHGTFESCAVQPNKSKDMFILSDQLTKQCICLLGNYNSYSFRTYG